MANLPQSLSLNAPSDGVPTPANPNAVAATAAAAAGRAGANKDRKMVSTNQLLLDLSNPELLLELSMEIVLIYPVLSSPNLTTAQSNRVCNALALLQCVASHQDTRMPFLNAQIPLYLYRFVKTTSKLRPYEYPRLTSLGVIGALVKEDTTTRHWLQQLLYNVHVS